MSCNAVRFDRPAPGVARNGDVAMGRIAATMWRVLDLLAVWRDRAQLRRDLPLIDARMLRDIGITRDQLEREAEKPFWRL